MNPILIAGMRSLRSLMRGDIFWHLLWPTLAAVVFWGLVAAFTWTSTAAGVVALIHGLPLVGSWMGDGSVVSVLVNISLLLLLLPLIYVTASVLVAVIAIPVMLDRLAATDYQDLEQRRGGSMAGSIANAVLAVVIFCVCLLLSLPLWLIPGLGIAISVFLSAWLNQRCYRYDALMNHADSLELRRIAKNRRGGMYILGGGAAILAFVPILNLFVPALTGLMFVHYLLEALRVERARPMKTVY